MTTMMIYLIASLLMIFPSNTISEKDLYNPNKVILETNRELSFWTQKWQQAPNQSAYLIQLSSLHAKLFSLTSNIYDLRQAESLLEQCLDLGTTNPTKIYHLLAHNYIQQHRFCDALDVLQLAKSTGRELRRTDMMLFDVYAELENETEQLKYLKKISNLRDFEFLIRKAKWMDGQGELEEAISLMEEARELAEYKDHEHYLSWIYSNLGDFYGHAAEIETSREYYIKSLEINPADWYSMKGLAWIEYAGHNNPHAALDILNQIDALCTSPAIDMLKSEVHKYISDTAIADKIEEDIANKVQSEEYGVMYNNYLVNYYIGEGQVKKAMSVAMEEVTQRPTTSSFDLLAQVHYAMGNEVEAIRIAERYIMGKTYEPAILYNLLDYYGQNTAQHEWLYQEVSGASYELGPLMIKAINPTKVTSI